MCQPTSHKSENRALGRAIMVSDLSLHDRAIYETSIKLLMDSIGSGKEFCKLMVAVSMSAIPIYLYLLVITLPDNSNLGVLRGLMLLSPAITFLLSAVIFSIGFLLGTTPFPLDIVNDIEKTRIKIIRNRHVVIILASLCFTAASLAAMTVIVKAHL